MPDCAVFQPARIGFNAQLLSTSASYRSAGTSRYIESLLREFQLLNGPEEILVYLNAENVPPALTSGQVRLKKTRLPTWRPAVRILWEQLLWPLQLRMDRASLVHGPAHALPLAWKGPSVLTIHDLSFLVDASTFQTANQRYLRWAVASAARRATRIIAVSGSTREDAIRLLGVSGAKVDVIHEGAGEEFRVLPAEVVSRFRAEQNLPDRFMLFLGTVEPRKNLVRLIEAYAGLDRQAAGDCPLIIAGGVRPGGEMVLQRAAQLGVGERVRFVGFVPEEDKPLWYNSACLFTYPSLYEGFGLPVLEAFACGTPVITSNRSSLPEVVGDAGLLVDPLDVSALTQAMSRALSDVELRDRLVKSGLARSELFSWRRAAEQTLDTYRHALAEAA